MKTSIRVQWAITTMIIISGTLLLCWFINNTFLEDYYELDKERIVQTTYERLNTATMSNTLETDDFKEKLMEDAFRYNMGIEVVDQNSEIVFVASFNGAQLQERLFRYIMRIPISSGIDKEQMPEPGSIFKVVDIRNNTEYIETYGQLDDGSWYIISTTMESIRDSVRLSNRFLAYIGAIAIVLGCIISWMVSKKVAKPILELAEISEKMTHLDFEAKYQGREHNEIGLLGENINKLSESLEQNISDLKTANNELQKDIEKKEQIDEMRKEFLSNVSHELKTPIALIQGYAEGLKEGIYDDPESMDFYCEVIMDEANKMNTMVKRLLTLNQLEFGNDVVSMERFDIVALIRNYLQSADILIKQNEVEVRLQEAVPIYVWADEFKTEEVFMNYFTNAVYHCEGKKIIDITFEHRDGRVRVGIFNTGEQIPKESLIHLWEKFYKVDKARTREYGGSGVGLSIVKAIMESMNQQYGVENYNNGVKFWFELETVKES